MFAGAGSSHFSIISVLACFAVLPAPLAAQDDNQTQVEVGAHVGRNIVHDQNLFGIEGRVYPSGTNGSMAFDFYLSRYPVDEFFKRTAASAFASWAMSSTPKVDFAGGPGIEYWHERLTAGPNTVSNSYTVLGAHLEARFKFHDRVFPVAEARILGLGSLYVALKVGARLRIL